MIDVKALLVEWLNIGLYMLEIRVRMLFFFILLKHHLRIWNESVAIQKFEQQALLYLPADPVGTQPANIKV